MQIDVARSQECLRQTQMCTLLSQSKKHSVWSNSVKTASLLANTHRLVAHKHAMTEFRAVEIVSTAE